MVLEMGVAVIVETRVAVKILAVKTFCRRIRAWQRRAVVATFLSKPAVRRTCPRQPCIFAQTRLERLKTEPTERPTRAADAAASEDAAAGRR